MNDAPKMSNAEKVARERLAHNGRNPANKNAGIPVGSDLHLCEMLLDELDAARKPLVTDAATPNGRANLEAILADQPFANSALSVIEIQTILANTGGFMPDEAVAWFREARGSRSRKAVT